MNGRRLRPPVVDSDLDQDVLGSRLGILNKDVEVAILSEDTRVEQLVLEFVTRTFPVRLDQIPVGKRSLWIFVKILQIGMRRSGVQVEVILLDVFAVITLAVRQSEQPLFEDG